MVIGQHIALTRDGKVEDKMWLNEKFVQVFNLSGIGYGASFGWMEVGQTVYTLPSL